ncbi:DUF7310 family coiled-coil domain-containing protein [Haloplanus halobius]|uniref:DUF7310 family coiled-coil domain-containing protein n=1 Tax=Haloplanus halobius TaxID=2934938 RepID=UPI00200DB409|nr:hypothetical protein [Haloplanus sp. XH21]
MADDRPLDDRLDAVERAVTDGEAVDGLPEAARLRTRLDELETTVDDFDDRLADLEAAVQALRGFAGGVRAVDESVERRANAAVARVDRLEAELREAGIVAADASDAATGDDAHPPTTNRRPRGTDRASPSTGTTAAATGDPPDGGPSSPTATPSNATLAETVAARARSADDAVVADDEAGEPTDRSLADRLRRLL